MCLCVWVRSLSGFCYAPVGSDGVRRGVTGWSPYSKVKGRSERLQKTKENRQSRRIPTLQNLYRHE